MKRFLSILLAALLVSGGALAQSPISNPATIVNIVGGTVFGTPITGVTGTVNVVLSASPTLTGTAIAATLNATNLNGILGAGTPAAITGTAITAGTSVTTPIVTTASGALAISPTLGAIFGGASLTTSAGEVGLTKITASGVAPGATGAKLALVCGTNAGTAKLIITAGTSATAVPIADNIGAAVTGC